MAVPILNLVRPGRAWSAGGALVQIDGNDFRVRPAAARGGSGPSPAGEPTVEVLFGGIASPEVHVVSSAILRCIVPRHPPDRYDNGALITSGTVDVTVRNLDDSGMPLVGEETTLSEAFVFVRPELGSREIRGGWLRVIEAWLEHWRSIVMENVVWNPAVDYDPETGDVQGFIDIGQMPGIAVTQVTFPESDLDPIGGEEEARPSEADILLRQRPVANDVSFQFVIVSDNTGELLNIAQIVNMCFQRAGAFEVAVDPGDAAQGMAGFEQFLIEPIAISDRIGRSGVMTATARGMVRRILSADVPGLPTEGLPGVPRWGGHEATRGLTRPLDRVSIGRGRR